MDKNIKNTYTIKIEKFEGPFELLFHLFGKDKIDIYDIPINEVTDQYMEYLFAMQDMDLELASEFLVMASTLLQIKSKMLLPKQEKEEVIEEDPREELVEKLLEYKRYREMADKLVELEKKWANSVYKSPELIDFKQTIENFSLLPIDLKDAYFNLLSKNESKINKNLGQVTEIILRNEKVSLREKMVNIIESLIERTYVRFKDVFSTSNCSKMEVVTGFLAMLELAKLKKAIIEQDRLFDDIFIHRNMKEFDDNLSFDNIEEIE